MVSTLPRVLAACPTNAANVPALVLYGPDRTAIVLHRAGDGHENAAATRARLERRGYAVVPAPPDLTPYLTGASGEVRERARQILRALAVAA